jgi:hypothetical protein
VPLTEITLKWEQDGRLWEIGGYIDIPQDKLDAMRTQVAEGPYRIGFELPDE